MPLLLGLVVARPGAAPLVVRADVFEAVAPLTCRGARLASEDPREAAWGAYELRVRGLSELAPALWERLARTPEGDDVEGSERLLRLGLFDAAWQLGLELPPELGRTAMARDRVATLALAVRHPGRHLPLLRAAAATTARRGSGAEWLAPTLALLAAGDATFVRELLARQRPVLRLDLVDPTKSRAFLCGTRAAPSSSHASRSVFVPSGHPPTGLLVLATSSRDGAIPLARLGREAVYVRRLVAVAGSGVGVGSGGTGRDLAAVERELLVAAAGVEAGAAFVLGGGRRRYVWGDPEGLAQALAYWDEEQAARRRELLAGLAAAIGMDPAELDDALVLERRVHDARTVADERPPLPAGWIWTED